MTLVASLACRENVMTTTWLPSGFRFVSPSLPGLKSKHTVTGMRSLSKILWLVVGTWWFQPKSSHDWRCGSKISIKTTYICSVDFSLHLSIVKQLNFLAARSWFRKFYDSLWQPLVKLYLNHQLFGGHHGTRWEAWQPQHPLHPGRIKTHLRATACKVILCVIAIEMQY